MRTSWQTFQRAWAKVFGSPADYRKPRVTFTCDGSMLNFPKNRNLGFGAAVDRENYRNKCIRRNTAIMQEHLIDDNIKRAHQHYGRCGSGTLGGWS